MSKRIRNIRVWVCMLFACTPLLSFARISASDFRNVSDVGGHLLDMTVSSVWRDSTGYVWLGNGFGVDRFDGVRLKHYPIEGSDAKYRRVRAIASLPGQQDVYAGNGDGLWRLHPGGDAFARVLPEGAAQQSFGEVNDLLPVGQGRMLVATTTGLYDYNSSGNTMEPVPLVDAGRSSPSNRISSIALSGDTLFAATDAGVISLSGDVPVLYDYPVGFNSVVATPSKLFLGTDASGVVNFDRRTGALTPFRSLGSNVITDLTRDGNTLYVATDGAGVVAVDTRTDSVVARLTHKPGVAGGLSSNAVYAVYVDSAGLLWVGYYQLGASYQLYSSGIFDLFTAGSYSTAGRAVRVVRRHGPYTLIGTRDGVVVVDISAAPGNQVTHYEMPALRSNMIISAEWYRGHFVVGTYGGGMHVIDPAARTVGDVEASAPDYPFRRGHVFSLTAHPDGSIWCGTSAGLFRYTSSLKNRMSWTSENSQLPPGNIYAIFFDSRGNGWICTENGLALYNPVRNTISSKNFPKNFFNDRKFKDVYEDSSGRLYFLPEHGDVCYSNIDMTEFGTLGAPNGDFCEPRAIVEDADGCIWLATSNGIFSRSAGSQEWREYGSTDGVVSPLFIDCTPIADASGRLWFGNSRGLLSVRPGDVEHRGSSGEFILRPAEVFADGKAIEDAVSRSDGGYVVRLPSHAGSITLCLTPLNFADTRNLHYQYNLDGGDRWHDLDRSFNLTFYSLAGGTHRLLLRQAGRPDTRVAVDILQPQPVWLWICAVAVIVAVLSLCAWLRHVLRQRAHAVHGVQTPAADPVAETNAADTEEQQARKYKTYTMREEEGRDIAGRLERIMSESKPYTNPDLRLADLAEMAGVSGHRLSFYFSQYLHSTFYDYVNRRRIDEFKRLAASPEAARYTLTALSAKAGFSSRTSFFRYFKKAEGITPAEYLERLNK